MIDLSKLRPLGALVGTRWRGVEVADEKLVVEVVRINHDLTTPEVFVQLPLETRAWRLAYLVRQFRQIVGPSEFMSATRHRIEMCRVLKTPMLLSADELDALQTELT